jgi:hypothetical protein
MAILFHNKTNCDTTPTSVSASVDQLSGMGITLIHLKLIFYQRKKSILDKIENYNKRISEINK